MYFSCSLFVQKVNKDELSKNLPILFALKCSILFPWETLVEVHCKFGLSYWLIKLHDR